MELSSVRAARRVGGAALCLLMATGACAAGPRTARSPAVASTPLELKFPDPQDGASRYRVPWQLDALYRYPVSAPLGEDWGLSSYAAAKRRQLVVALLLYPPGSSAFEPVTLSDETGKSFVKVTGIFVDALESELGLQNAVLGSGPVRILAFFEVPESVHRVSILAGESRLPPTGINATGAVYQVKVEQKVSVQAAGWLKAQPGSSARRFAALIKLVHHHRNYDGLNLALSDSKHASKTRLIQIDPRVVLEVDEQLRPRDLPPTPEVVPARLVLVVYEPDSEWTTPDWILGLDLPPLEAIEERMPAQTLRRIDHKLGGAPDDK